MTEGQTQEWKVFFAELEGEGLFDGGDIDKSCLQYIYMDIIRSHIHQFVAIHNSHSIRRQRRREHYLPTGQPFLLYHYPDGIKNYMEPADVGILSELESEVTDFDLDEYLPTATLSLYAQLLSAGGFPTEFVYSDIRHRSAYAYLRQKAADYIDQGGQITLFNTPSGAEEWILSHNNHEIESHRTIDHTLIIDETDGEDSQENNSCDVHTNKGKEKEKMEERLSQRTADRDQVTINQSSSNITHLEDTHIWDSVSEEDYDDTNDGYFLNL